MLTVPWIPERVGGSFCIATYSVGHPKAAPRKHPVKLFIQRLQKFTNNPKTAYLGSTKLFLYELQFYFVPIKFRKFFIPKNWDSKLKTAVPTLQVIPTAPECAQSTHFVCPSLQEEFSKDSGKLFPDIYFSHTQPECAESKCQFHKASENDAFAILCPSRTIRTHTGDRGTWKSSRQVKRQASKTGQLSS